MRLTKLENTPETSIEKTNENKEFNLDNGFNKVRFINEGYVSKDIMNDYIIKSSSLNSIDKNILELLETSFPNASIISTDEKVFVIRNNKILMLG